MDYYKDYLGFKEDKYDLIEFLASNNSNIIIRFKHVLAVVDYLYDKHCEGVKLDANEETIFVTGFNYVFERFSLIDLISSKIFKNNFEEMEIYSKTINLILYVNDFKDEVYNINEDNKQAISKFSDYEDKILKLLESKEHASDVDFALLDDLSINIFDELGEEYYGINEIFYDIALEMKIIDEDLEEMDLGI